MNKQFWKWFLKQTVIQDIIPIVSGTVAGIGIILLFNFVSHGELIASMVPLLTVFYVITGIAIGAVALVAMRNTYKRCMIGMFGVEL